MALRAVAEDCDGLALELREVGVLVIEDVVWHNGRASLARGGGL
jgi:hypothetical protein